MQSDSWRKFIESLQRTYIQPPDLPAIERACRAAVALADTPDDAPLVDVCLQAAVLALPVTGEYTTAARAQTQRTSSASAPFGSIGIEFGRQGGGPTGPIVVATPLPNSPAERAGVKPGDLIHEIDGRNITGLSTDEAVLGFRGAPGSLVRIRLARGNEAQLMTLDVVREVIRINHVRSKLLENGVVWARISQFGASASGDLARQLAHHQASLHGDVPQALILDLRHCLGGSLPEVQQALLTFLPAGTVVGWSRGRDETTPLRVQTLSPSSAVAAALDWRHVRLVVLVNSKTASGAELFAQALRRYRDAVLVGTRTAGSTQIDQLVILPNGAHLRMPQALILAADRSSWEDSGLVPDIEFEATSRAAFGAADDPGLAHALQWVGRSRSAP